MPVGNTPELPHVMLPNSRDANVITDVVFAAGAEENETAGGTVEVVNSCEPISVPKPTVVPLLLPLKSVLMELDAAPAMPFPFIYQLCGAVVTTFRFPVAVEVNTAEGFNTDASTDHEVRSALLLTLHVLISRSAVPHKPTFAALAETNRL